MYLAASLHLIWINAHAKRVILMHNKQVIMAIVAALVYCIWQQRNKKLWQQLSVEGAEVVKKIKTIVKLKVSMNEFKCNVEDCKWFVEL